VGGRAIAGEEGLTYGLILAVGMNFFSYFFSEKIALMSAQAKSVSQTQHPEVFGRLNPIAAI
jgi:heat shock protein HtpX